jgi:predicted RNA methylase
MYSIDQAPPFGSQNGHPDKLIFLVEVFSFSSISEVVYIRESCPW